MRKGNNEFSLKWCEKELTDYAQYVIIARQKKVTSGTSWPIRRKSRTGPMKIQNVMVYKKKSANVNQFCNIG